jgi:hypothetical protein
MLVSLSCALSCASDHGFFGGLLWVVCAEFIPKEELAKFMAQCGDDKLAQQVRDAVLCYDSLALGCCLEVGFGWYFCAWRRPM